MRSLLASLSEDTKQHLLNVSRDIQSTNSVSLLKHRLLTDLKNAEATPADPSSPSIALILRRLHSVKAAFQELFDQYPVLRTVFASLTNEYDVIISKLAAVARCSIPSSIDDVLKKAQHDLIVSNNQISHCHEKIRALERDNAAISSTNNSLQESLAGLQFTLQELQSAIRGTGSRLFGEAIVLPSPSPEEPPSPMASRSGSSDSLFDLLQQAEAVKNGGNKASPLATIPKEISWIGADESISCIEMIRRIEGEINALRSENNVLYSKLENSNQALSGTTARLEEVQGELGESERTVIILKEKQLESEKMISRFGEERKEHRQMAEKRVQAEHLALELAEQLRMLESECRNMAIVTRLCVQRHQSTLKRRAKLVDSAGGVTMSVFRGDSKAENDKRNERRNTVPSPTNAGEKSRTRKLLLMLRKWNISHTYPSIFVMWEHPKWEFTPEIDPFDNGAFLAFGTTSDIPAFLRAEGCVPRTGIGVKVLVKLLKELWMEKLLNDRRTGYRVPLSSFMNAFLNRKYGVQTPEYISMSYSLIYECERVRHSLFEVDLFMRVLMGIIPEQLIISMGTCIQLLGVSFDKAFAQFIKLEFNLNSRTVKKKLPGFLVCNVIDEHFPNKSLERLEVLKSFALSYIDVFDQITYPELLIGATDYVLVHAYDATQADAPADDDQDMFSVAWLTELRRQMVSEHNDFIYHFRTRLAELSPYPPSVAKVTIEKASELLWSMDRNLSQEEITEILGRVCDPEGRAFNPYNTPAIIDMKQSITVDTFVNNLRGVYVHTSLRWSL